MKAEKPAEKAVPEGMEAILILRDVARHSDRELAIVGTSLLEHSLKLLLGNCFRKLDTDSHNSLWGNIGALSSFSARIAITAALNIIGDDIEHDLHTIRKIRNHFAHTVQKIGFDDPDISQLCYSLRAPKSFPENYDPRIPIEKQATPRQVFYFSVETQWLFIQGGATGEALRKVTLS